MTRVAIPLILFSVAGCANIPVPVEQPTIGIAENAVTPTNVLPTPRATSAPTSLSDLDETQSCSGETVRRGRQNLTALNDGSFVTRAPMHVNVDGSGKAYHPDNFDGGAIIHLCNAGKVHLPDGTSYHGALPAFGQSANQICTGKFMEDVASIKGAGWNDANVGAVNWYGILGEGSVRVNGTRVNNVKPVLQTDGSGFYVSPTALTDRSFARDDQRRYVDALTVPHAVVRGDSGIKLGTFGVAIRFDGCPIGQACDPVPFIVGDIGPRIGEGSVALGRAVNGLPMTTDITRENRFDGHVDEDDVLWVFFGGEPASPPYTQEAVNLRAAVAFESWGGEERLERCVRSSDVRVASNLAR